MATSDPDTATQVGGTPISTRRAWLWSLDQFLLSPMGLQASRPFSPAFTPSAPWQ